MLLLQFVQLWFPSKRAAMIAIIVVFMCTSSLKVVDLTNGAAKGMLAEQYQGGINRMIHTTGSTCQ